MIRNLIWDVDGTLFDTYPAISRAFAAALAELGKSADLNWIDSLAKVSLSHCGSALAAKFDLDPNEVMLYFDRHYETASIKEQVPFPGVIQICEYVHGKGGVNVIITHRGRESTAQLLMVHNLAPYFADCMTANDGYPKKPDPAAFEAMIAKHGFKREETLAIGDRDIDSLAGQAAGVRTCQIGSPRSSEIVPDIVIIEFAQLYEILLAEKSK